VTRHGRRRVPRWAWGAAACLLALGAGWGVAWAAYLAFSPVSTVVEPGPVVRSTVTVIPPPVTRTSTRTRTVTVQGPAVYSTVVVPGARRTVLVPGPASTVTVPGPTVLVTP